MVVMSRCIQSGCVIVELYDLRQVLQQLLSYSIFPFLKPFKVGGVVIKRGKTHEVPGMGYMLS